MQLQFGKMETIMNFIITAEQSGKTVLSFLRSQLKISTSALASLKRDEKGILVNSSHVTVRYILKENDILFINEKDSSDSISENIPPKDLPLNILFENGDILVADKPAFMPTHPSHGHIDDTLANAVAFLYEQRNIPFVFRPIGRLDRNTSGISLIAKHSISASFLFYARQKDMIIKKYIALLEGELPLDGCYHTIDAYMKRREDSIIVRCIGNESEEGAFSAITHYKVLFSCPEISVVEAIPETGRTHQLRVHFAHIGHPILGDDIYGSSSEYIGRHALHACSLSFPLPYNTEELMTVTSQPPRDITEAFYRICQADLLDIWKNKFN